MTFNEAAESFLETVEVRESPATLRKIKGYLKRISELIGDYECKDINRKTMNKLIIHRREINPNVSNTTLNLYIQYTKMVLKEECNIDITYKKLKQTKKLPQTLDDITILKLFDYLDTQTHPEAIRNKLMFTIFYETGIRRSELLNIKLKNINLDANSIYLEHTKARKHRIVLFPDYVKQQITSHVIKNKITDYLFINLETRNKLHPDTIETICQRIQLKLGLKCSISPHKWRHTFGQRFNDENGNMFVLQKLLGHEDISTTMIYANVSMKKVKDEYFRIQKNRVK